jgi:hypothetical protein
MSKSQKNHINHFKLPGLRPKNKKLIIKLFKNSPLERSEKDLVLPKRNSGNETREAKLGSYILDSR